MPPLRIPRNLRLAVRSRVSLQSIDARNRRAYAGKVTPRQASVAGRNSVTIDGVQYPAAGLEDIAQGAAVKVVNVGSPASVLYRPQTGGSVSGQSAGGRSASTSGGVTSEGAAGASLLSELSDTTISADPADGAPLRWDGAAAKWLDADPALNVVGLLRELRYGAQIEDADLPVELIADGANDAANGVWCEWFTIADPEGTPVAGAGSVYVAPEGSASVSVTGDTLAVEVASDGSVSLAGELTVAHRVGLRIFWTP